MTAETGGFLFARVAWDMLVGSTRIVCGLNKTALVSQGCFVLLQRNYSL